MSKFENLKEICRPAPTSADSSRDLDAREGKSASESFDFSNNGGPNSVDSSRDLDSGDGQPALESAFWDGPRPTPRTGWYKRPKTDNFLMKLNKESSSHPTDAKI